VIFTYFIIALTVTVCTLQTQRLRIQDEHVRRDGMLALVFGVTGSYVSRLPLRERCQEYVYWPSFAEHLEKGLLTGIYSLPKLSLYWWKLLRRVRNQDKIVW
jgi:hypothetical protein